MILKKSFTESHPVLMIEDNLVEMAKSQLQESILAAMPCAKESDQKDLVISIRRAVADRISDSEEDDEIKAGMLLDVAREEFDDLFHPLH